MIRRELLGAFGAGITGMLASGALAAPPDEGRGHHHHTDKVHEDCMKACGRCAASCNMLAHHCMDQIVEGAGDVKKHARTHSIADDCQAFCVLSATMIARGSSLMALSCEACAEACKACAEECEKALDDAEHKACAETCRECEKSCREMVRHMKAPAAGR